MSFFPDLFKQAGSWLLQVNNVGEAVLYRLDSEGKPVSFAAGDSLDEVLAPALEGTGYAMVSCGETFFECTYGQFTRPQQLLPYLNGKKRANIQSQVAITSLNLRGVFNKWFAYDDEGNVVVREQPKETEDA